MNSSSSRFQRNDSHRLGSQNVSLLNLQMDNKVRNRIPSASLEIWDGLPGNNKNGKLIWAFS